MPLFLTKCRILLCSKAKPDFLTFKQFFCLVSDLSLSSAVFLHINLFTKLKIFHFRWKFSTSKKMFFYSKITWIGTFSRGGNFSTFGRKFSTLVNFFFRQLDPLVCQIWAQRCKVEIFPLWWKIFHFRKVAKKKIIPKSHELGH